MQFGWLRIERYLVQIKNLLIIYLFIKIVSSEAQITLNKLDMYFFSSFTSKSPYKMTNKKKTKEIQIS